MELFVHYFSLFNAYAKMNPIVAGATSLWGLAVISWFGRNIPNTIWNKCKHELSTTLQINNSSTGNNLENFSSFLLWFNTTRWARYSRSIAFDGSYTSTVTDGITVGPGDGRHFFIYKRHFFWLHRERNSTSALSTDISYELKIVMLGRNRKILADLIDEFRYRPKSNKVGIYQWTHSGSEWTRVADVNRRNMSSVIIRNGIRDKIVNAIDEWCKSEEWYRARGLPYKLTYILHGPTGTGKTSLIKALASHYGYNLCTINLGDMSDRSLEPAFASTPEKSFIVIEDFDSSIAVNARDGMGISVDAEHVQQKSVNDAVKNGGKKNAEPPKSSLTLTGILNSLDGIIPLDNKIVFMTTNVLNKVDAALVRKGRVDDTYHIGLLADTEVREYIRLMFPEAHIPKDVVFEEICGCDIQDLYFKNRHVAKDFINSIPVKALARIVDIYVC